MPEDAAYTLIADRTQGPHRGGPARMTNRTLNRLVTQNDNRYKWTCKWILAYY